MKIIIITAICLFLIGCNFKETAPSQETVNNKMVYFQDTRTNLCFTKTTSLNSYGSITSITNVPCTKEVVAMIKSEK